MVPVYGRENVYETEYDRGHVISEVERRCLLGNVRRNGSTVPARNPRQGSASMTVTARQINAADILTYLIRNYFEYIRYMNLC